MKLDEVPTGSVYVALGYLSGSDHPALRKPFKKFPSSADIVPVTLFLHRLSLKSSVEDKRQ